MASVTGRGEWARRALALVLALVLSGASVVSQESPTDYTFRSTSELVLVNVTARDKNGNPVRDLKREDFTILRRQQPAAGNFLSKWKNTDGFVDGRD